eukprot:gene18566-39140_t
MIATPGASATLLGTAATIAGLDDAAASFGGGCVPGQGGSPPKAVSVPAADAGGCLGDLVREIELMRDLDHPNIVRYLGAVRDDERGVLYILMEFVAGGSIASIVRKYGGLAEET